MVSLPSDVVSVPADVESESASAPPPPVSSAMSVPSIEMPSDVEEGPGLLTNADSGRANAFDDSVSVWDDDDAELIEHMGALAAEGCSGTPEPQVAELLSAHQDLAEFYSPPRVLPCARTKGLTGCLSLDLLCGWDFRVKRLRNLSLHLLSVLSIMLVILSPPCTIFSELQRLWNFKRMLKETFEAKWAEGMLYLEHAMLCCMCQHNAGRAFVFEHPARASSWKTSVVQAVMKLPGVFLVTFDQCMLGLCTKVHGVPTRKRTTIMTNSRHIASRFAHLMCDKTHEHRAIEGSEGGIRRSVWAQKYPAPMVNLLALGALDICNSR